MSDEFDIAIVGLAGRFPGAPDIDTFWRNLAGGVESITRFSDEDLLRSGVPASWLALPNYVKAAPILDEPGHFDAAFFGFAPMEARIMDPQHRILLELAHEALENAGYDPDRYQGRVGVFSGSALNTYYASVGLNNRLAEDYIPTLIGNDKDFLSTRISYKLNLRGPSITVQTACSTSMVAVHLARQSLLSGETDMALAGGVSLRVPHRAGYFADAGGVVSPEGRVRAFDASANGTVFGSGGGMLVLKRLEDALADGDTIRAVIKGSAVNNDGSEKAGYTAPSVRGQVDVVVEALANAGVDAGSISYVEAHGSGTPLGDPIEISALTKAFRVSTSRAGFCAIGSVKTNIGHLDAAAAVAGLIKTVLALEHRKLPPSLHFNDANLEIDFAATPFSVNSRLQDWSCEGPRRAGVMSTGMGGTNAHVVLEEAPERAASTATGSAHLLVLSARTEAALDRMTHRLVEFLGRNDTVTMGDVAHTLQVGRKAFAHRRCVACASVEDAIATLGDSRSKRVQSGVADDVRRPVVFLLPGIGDHYVGMAHELYETWPLFKQEVDRCARILEAHLSLDIRAILYPASRSWKREGMSKGIDLKKMLAGQAAAAEDEGTRELNRTLFAQPALFTIEYALCRAWQSLGITPDALVGHSMGEYVAACLAGVLSLEDALRLIAIRARLVEALPQGAMLAVTLPERELLSLLPADLSLSLINGPNLCVVAGLAASVAEFEKMLDTRDVICRRVQNAHAFHSRMLDPIVKAFAAEVARVELNEPRIPYVSNVTGTWITAREATNPDYWALHATRTARFNDALHEVWQLGDPVLVEVGPGRTLGVLAMQHPDRPHGGVPVVVSSVRHRYENQSDVEFQWHAIGKLWVTGKAIRWDGGPAGDRGRRVPLPTYPFEKQNYWLETPPSNAKQAPDQSSAPALSGLDNSFYVPTWERTPFPREIDRGSQLDDAFWLIFADRYGGGACVRTRLDVLRRPTAFVRFGASFFGHPDGSFDLNPAGVDDYLKLFSELARRGATAINIVHLGSLTQDDGETTHAFRASSEDFGFYSLLHIAQAAGELDISFPIKIAIVSNRIHEVTGEERLDPAMATVLGPCGVIPREFPNISCFNIDLPDNQPIDRLPHQVIASILAEFAEPSKEAVAYRGRHRWARRYEPVRLPRDQPAEFRRLRRGGVYLITGGTGGIGLSIARYLAKVCQPRIVLTKKTPFPEKSRWRELLTAKDSSDGVVRTINEILEIERLGAEVEIFVAEASDQEKMQEVVNETRKRIGAINGVVHAAGLVRPRLIESMTNEMADSVLSPKVRGTMVLLDLFKEDNLDFMVLLSSMASVAPPFAHADYSAANCFLDAFAHYANSLARFHTVAINWPVWKEVGIGAGTSYYEELEALLGVEDLQEEMLKSAILTVDGLEALRRVLNSDLSQVIVSPEPLDRLIEKSRAPLVPALHASQAANDAGGPSKDTSQRHGGAESANDVEATVAKAWNSVFGFDHIGVDDNFSQLGGHSLLAMQIVARIRSSYQIGFTLREFFASPTIAGLSAVVQTKIGGKGTSPNEQARPLVAPMGQRFFCAARTQKAYYAGLGNQQMFVTYHPAVGDGRVLTIICPPLFNEYMRTHLALRELAISLAERGQHVLRFDYRGTGDSYGDLDEVVISDWVDDIVLAVREGCELSGSSAVRLLGVRASGLLACRAASAFNDVERLVLWDPVPDAASYLQALRRIQATVSERDLHLSRAERFETLREYAGYRLSERMLGEFHTLDASAYSSVPKSKLYVIGTSLDGHFAMQGVAQEVVRFPCSWDTNLDDLLMPKPVLERLGACLIMS